MIIQKRLKRLRKVVDEYLLFTRWKAVNVFIEDDNVFVAWLRPKVVKKKDNGGEDGFYIDFTHRVFPVSDLNKKIRSYRDKIIIVKAKLKEEKG